MQTMSKSVKIGIAVVFAIIIGIVIYSTLNLSRYECEVCIEFGGRTQCRTAAGSAREEAIRTATDNACALLTSGMTNSIACGHTPPKSIRWIKQ